MKLVNQARKLQQLSTAAKRQANPTLETTYRPRGSIARGLELTSREVIFSGPAGTGKSFGILHKIHTLCEAYPHIRVLILRKTRASLSDSALVTFEEKVVPDDHPILEGPERENRRVYRYPNGSVIVLGGMDKPRKLFSTEYDLIYWQECQEGNESEWESLLRALRNNKMPYQQIIGDCNPESPQHWIKTRSDRGVCTLIETRLEDNPVLWDLELGTWTPEGERYVLGVLEGLTGVRYKRLREGKWVSAEGQVYEDYDPATHLVEPFEIPQSWRRIRVVDFGYTNPFTCQWWAVDRDGRMYLYRELYRTKRLVTEHARDILRLSEGEYIEATIADHDAEDRATLHAAGIPTLPANKTLTRGIEWVQRRFKPQGDGKPRLFIFKDALVERDELLAEDKKPLCLAQELPEYVFPKSSDGKPNKEEPVKLHDHGCDAMRYGVAYVENPIRRRSGMSGYQEDWG